ncbi:hypothetical protein HYH02_002140 [Chlamydomonas schloesseri]|uniref:Uncharacterized protein n=1 Tax=Chlamydomonas schloesseri TaxID=2026947 RepID=A0A836BBX4_9CHLO|nr:hypothetical protein HYH02_002140 [Chlamydomonas schloesseri]|eukprot:KAG2453937.1 hypothetical protein HYH02_002140 [Chlamydomonas schloesseri]
MGWLADTASMSQPGRSPKRARLEVQASGQQPFEQQQQQHHTAQPGAASAGNGSQRCADTPVSQQAQISHPRPDQAQQLHRALPAAVAAAASTSRVDSSTPPRSSTGAGVAGGGAPPVEDGAAGGIARPTLDGLPEGAMLLARCPARRSPGSSPGSKRAAAGELPAGALLIESCRARRSPSCSPPGGSRRAGGGGGSGAFEGGSPPPPLRSATGHAQLCDAVAVGLARRGEGTRGASAAGGVGSHSGRLGPGATYFEGTGGGGGGGGGGGAARPPRAPQFGNLHGLMLQAKGLKQPLAQIQNHAPPSTEPHGGLLKVRPLGSSSAGVGACNGSGGVGTAARAGAGAAHAGAGTAPLSYLGVGALLSQAQKAAAARKAAGVHAAAEAEEFVVPRTGLEAVAAGIPLGRAIY